MDSPISTRAAILQVLAVECCHGSAVIEKVSDLTAERLVLHSGSLYPALAGLEDEGLIRRKRMIESQEARSGRQRIYYELTRKGRDIVRRHRTIALAVFFPGDALKEHVEWPAGSSSTSTVS